MNSINFDNVWLLFIAIPIIALVAVPFAFAVRSDNRNGHNVASLVLHIIMAVLIAFAAAGTSVVTVLTKTEVYVLADVSYSANKNLDTVDGYINELKGNLPRNSSMGLICFAKTPLTVTQPGGKIVSVRTALGEGGVDESETDISGALEYAGGLFSDGVIKRIVLITDGRQSDLRDSGSLKRTADELALKGIKIDAIYLDDNIDLYGGADKVKEIQISRADFTKNTFLNNDKNRVTAYINSSYEVNNLPVTLYRDGEVFGTPKYVNLKTGSNTVSFDLPADTEAVYDYRISIEGLDEKADKCSFNNAYSFTQRVCGSVSVMLLTEDAANETYLRSVYGEECELTSYVLQKNGKDITGKDIPVTVEDLSAFDEIVLADVDITKLSGAMTFVDSLKKVVTVLGKHLVTIGDLGIQSSDNDVLRALDDMLPVKYGHNDNDPKLYALVIDTSRSMELNYRMIMAKQAAKQLVSFLNENDQVLIVEFNGDVRLALDVTEASKTQTINAAIDGLGVLQSTVIYKGLERAYNEIEPLTSLYSERQVMMITDGLSYSLSNEDEQIKSVVSDMSVNNIKLSVIDVGRGGGGSSTDDTAQKLKSYVAMCKGDYFYAISPEMLENIMFEDIKQSQNDLIIDANCTITRNRRQDDVYEDFAEENEKEYITGFVNSSAKPSAITVLKANYYKAEVGADMSSPLYAYRDYTSGGRVSTYTTSISKSQGWTNSGQFFKNVLKTNIPAEKNSAPYTLETTVKGDFAQVQLTPLIFYPDARAEIEIKHGENVQTYGMSANSSGFYYDIDVADLGKYAVKVDYYCNGSQTPYTFETAINLDYKSEYDMFANFDASNLYKIVGNGQVSEDGKLKIENDDREVGKYEYSLIVPLLVACAVLFVADVIVRKLKWSDIKNLFVKIGKSDKREKKG